MPGFYVGYAVFVFHRLFEERAEAAWAALDPEDEED